VWGFLPQLYEVIVLVTIGIVVGFGAAIGLTRYVKSQLFGLTTMDPITLVAATLGLGVVACVAGFIPADRASRVDAIQALRYE
jgi:ABC-type antimicrobial peptide transport system permease subunit